MNFPEVPFDENLFASNTMLKSYWERSTNDRPATQIPDWPSEEASESKELRAASEDHWSTKNDKTESLDTALDAESVAENIELAQEKKDSIDSRVEPKMSSGATAWVVVLSVVGALFIAYFFMQMGYKSRRV